MAYRHLIFDLDGTIIDPKEGITGSVAFALGKMGLIQKDLDLLTKYIGPPLTESLVQYNQFNPEQVREAVGYYREHFKQYGIMQNKLYLGMVDLLVYFREQGIKLYIATSKPLEFAQIILKNYGIDHLFTYIMGSNLDGTRVKKGEVIAELLKVAQLNDPSEIVMIGDREHDVIGAFENGIASIGVEYGFGSFEELDDAGATYVVESISQLKALLDRLI